MTFSEWLYQFDFEARAQVGLDHRDLGLELTDLEARFEQGLTSLAVFNTARDQLNMLPFAEFALGAHCGP